LRSGAKSTGDVTEPIAKLRLRGKKLSIKASRERSAEVTRASGGKGKNKKSVGPEINGVALQTGARGMSGFTKVLCGSGGKLVGKCTSHWRKGELSPEPTNIGNGSGQPFRKIKKKGKRRSETESRRDLLHGSKVFFS